MKLVLNIVNSDDAGELLEKLMEQHYQAYVIGTPDMLFSKDYTTVAIKAEDSEIPEILNLVKNYCQQRTEYINALPLMMEPGEMSFPTPITLTLGGATVFVLDVAQFHQF